jgi:hypothetical protein
MTVANAAPRTMAPDLHTTGMQSAWIFSVYQLAVFVSLLSLARSVVARVLQSVSGATLAAACLHVSAGRNVWLAL